jgi:hypothetical protein
MTLMHALTPETCQRLDVLLNTDPPGLSLTALKADGGPRHVEGLLTAVDNPSCDLLEIHELLRSNTGWKSHLPQSGESSWTKKL